MPELCRAAHWRPAVFFPESGRILAGLVAKIQRWRGVRSYPETDKNPSPHSLVCAVREGNFPDRRLAPIAPVSAYPSIAPLLGKRIRTDIINEQWDDVLRLVGSIKAGHVAPSVMLRKLAAYERQNQLDVALQEIGKIERTLFMLDWLENPDLRRRCHAGLTTASSAMP
jgi:hypothetical protein